MTIKIKRDSMLIQFAETFGGLHTHSMTNTTCELAKSLLLGAFGFVLMFGFTVWLSASYGDFFAWIAASLIHSDWDFPGPLSILAVCITIIVVGTALCHAIKMYNEHRAIKRAENHTPPSAAKILWDSFVKKVCAKIEYID